MENFREFLRNKRNLLSLVILLFIAITIPLGLFLVSLQQTYRSNAAGELIQLADGPCIQTINGKKVAICTNIPLKLINPFSAGAASPSAASTASANPSPSSRASTLPSPSTAVSPSPSAAASAVNCATTASTGAEILAAMSCYKSAAGTGRKLTLAAGTFEMDKKISVPSNLTIAGAGMGSTIIKKSGSFGSDDALMANDSSAGQQNIVLRDFTLQGDNVRSGNSCCYGLKLQNITGAFVINVASNNWGIDGIFLGQRPNKPGAKQVRITGCVVNNNGRNGISLVDASDNVIDHCQLSGNSANELVSAIDLEPDTGNNVNNNHIFANSITNNKNNGIQLLENPNDPGGVVSNNFICDNTYGGNNGTDFADSGFATSTSGCSAGNLNPPAAFLISTSTKLAGTFSVLLQKTASFLSFTKSSMQSWLTPKPVYAGYGFSGISIHECGEVLSKPALGASEGDITYKAPTKESVGWVAHKSDGSTIRQEQMQFAHTSDAGLTGDVPFIFTDHIDCKLFVTFYEAAPCTVSPLPNGGVLTPGQTVTFHVSIADSGPTSCNALAKTVATAAVSPSPIGAVSPSPLTSPRTTLVPAPSIPPDEEDNDPVPPPGVAYRLSDTQAGLAQSQWVNYTTSLVVTNFTITATPGPKQIWVEFRNNSGQTLIDHLPSFDLLAPAPIVNAVNCTLDIINKNVKIAVTGTNFGATNGTMTAGTGAADIVSWSDTSVVSLLKNPAETGQKYSVVLKRPDTLQSPPQTCEVNTSTLSVGATVFCRDKGQFDVANVKVSLFDPLTPAKKIEETATIDKDGLLQGIKTKLATGTQYVISMKAPYSVRRNASFTLYEGTSVVNAPDGKPFILPIGDISPAEGDGQINALDRAELVKQWRILPNASSSAQALTGDFNRDSRVNSIDWACMKYDFNATDDEPDSPGSTYKTGTGNFSSGQNSAIFTTP